MLENGCVTSSSVENFKQNGNFPSVLTSPVSRKEENVHSSPESRPGQPQVSTSTPDSGSHLLDENCTPDVKSQCKSKYYACPPSGSLKYLHRTPPSRTKSIVVTNPFDVGITDRLHLPMYSPSVFARVVSPSQDSPTFRWTIEDISRIYPADIEEFPAHQYEEVVDPELESKAQEAINRFFCKNQPLLPSPWSTKPDSNAALRQEANAGTPTNSHVATCSTPAQPTTQRSDPDPDPDMNSSSLKIPSREVWTQTTLTLPPILPPSMELALKPFFTFTQDQQLAQQQAPPEGDDGVLSTSSLRRKLFFQSDSSPSPTPSTPPHQHSAFLYGATSQSLVQFQGRSFGTPLPGSNALQSPPGISPVQSCATPMRRVKSATRLDFTRDQEEMSVDASLPNPPSTPRQSHLAAQGGACSPLGTAPLHDKDAPEDSEKHSRPSVKWFKRNKRNSLDCSTESMSISQASTPVKSNMSMDISSAHNIMDISLTKPSSQGDGWRESEALGDAAYQHEGTSFSYSHQAASSSNMMSQDTGYGTRSSCDPGAFQSGTASMFGLSLTRDKMGYEDSLATWPINPNVVSSTPTKTLGARISEYQRDTA